MDFYNLGSVGWLESQLIYHALPRLGMEGLILLSPNSPYVCIGRHQDAEQEVDLAFCESQGIPVFRREVGGGAVYLDGQQIFYQLVIRRDRLVAQGSKDDFYRRTLAPVIAACRDLGLEASYKPVNDILVGGRKISGNGAGEIGDAIILVGNLILDFDYDMMSRVLRVPDEKFRDKVNKSLRDNLTTLGRELPAPPTMERVAAVLAVRFAELLGPLTPQALPPAVLAEVKRLAPELTAEPWLMRRGRQQPGRQIKVAAGREVIQRAYKAPGGLIRGTFELADGRFAAVEFSGDFFFFPPAELDALALALVGAPRAEAGAIIEAFYAQGGIESPGVTPADLARVLAEDARV